MVNHLAETKGKLQKLVIQLCGNVFETLFIVTAVMTAQARTAPELRVQEFESAALEGLSWTQSWYQISTVIKKCLTPVIGEGPGKILSMVLKSIFIALGAASVIAELIPGVYTAAFSLTTTSLATMAMLIYSEEVFDNFSWHAKIVYGLRLLSEVTD